MNRAHVLRAAGALAGAFATLGADTPPAKIVVGPGVSPDMAAFYRGIETGAFKNAGLDLQILPIANGGTEFPFP